MKFNKLNLLTYDKLDELKAIKEKGVKNMTGLEILYNEYDKKYKEGRNDGIREGELKIIKIIKNMIKKELSIKDISNLTGINEKQILEIKEEIESIA